MRTVTLTLLLFFIAELQAQVVFCPLGAAWTAYYRNTIFSESTANSSLIYVADSIVGSDTLKVLYHSRFYNQCNKGSFDKTLVKQKGDTIFFTNRYTQNTWQIWVNYACAVGQSWTTTYTIQSTSPIKTYTYTVDSTDYVTENGFVLKRLWAHYTNSFNAPWQVPITIYERYGFGFPFQYQGRTSACDGDFFMGSLCYGDTEFGTKFFSQLPCTLQNLTDITDIKTQSNFQILPNPSMGLLRVSGGSKETQLEILDVVGKLVLQKVIVPNEEVDLRQLADGVYFLKMEGTVTLHKIVILKN